MSIAENLARVEARVEAAARRAGRDPAEVSLVAVVKNRSLDDIRALHATGHRLVAINRVQEAREKIPALPDDFVWHMIGHIQTNKAKVIPRLFRVAHSVDSARVAAALERAQRRRVEAGEAPAGERFGVLLEVNVSGEASKHGLRPEEAETTLREVSASEGLRALGLMTMAPFAADPEAARPVFRALAELGRRLRGLGLDHAPMGELSMGMTNDFEVAVEEGATLVRVGTAIFERGGAGG